VAEQRDPGNLIFGSPSPVSSAHPQSNSNIIQDSHTELAELEIAHGEIGQLHRLDYPAGRNGAQVEDKGITVGQSFNQRYLPEGPHFLVPDPHQVPWQAYLLHLACPVKHNIRHFSFLLLIRFYQGIGIEHICPIWHPGIATLGLDQLDTDYPAAGALFPI
jgi:hypothetical protein